MKDVNVDVIDSARKAWNELSYRLDSDPVYHENNESFVDFYKALVTRLFEEETKE